MKTIFFFDDYALDTRINVERRFGKPERVADESPFITHGYIHVWNTDDGYRMWSKYVRPGATPLIALATSNDGFHWEKPAIASGGPDIPNMVMEHATEQCVFYDRLEKGGSSRYKMLARLKPPEGAGYEAQNVYAVSDDGIDWRVDPEVVWHPFAREKPIDGYYHLMHNPVSGQYQILCRMRGGDRRIALCESGDLRHWSEPRVLLHPDPLDPPCAQLYGMPAFWYDDIFVGFLWIFVPSMGSSMPGNNDGVMYPELVYSYDGIAWIRTHHTIIDLEEKGDWGSGIIFTTSLVEDSENRLRIYSGVTNKEHGSIIHRQKHAEYAVQAHLLRRDGFVRLESVGLAGQLRTKSFLLRSGEIAMNIKAPYGDVMVQLSDRECRPYPGFTFDECVPWHGDEIAYHPRWKTAEDAKRLIGKNIRIELRLREAAVYAVRGDFAFNYSNWPVPLDRF